MFDIHFFTKINAIKKDLLKGLFRGKDKATLIDKFEQQISAKPHVFNLETTNHCNMKCVMCPRTSLMTRKRSFIEDNEFKKVLDQIVPHTESDLKAFWDFVKGHYGLSTEINCENSFYFYIVSRCLILHGYGEPLLDRNIVQRVAECSKRNIPTYFSCVPANLTAFRAEQLMEAGLTVLKVSIDSLDDFTQKQIRGQQNNFTRSIETIRKILEIKKSKNYKTLIVPTMIALSDTQDSHQMYRNFIEMWKGMDVHPYVKSVDNRWYMEDEVTPENRSHYEQQYCEYPWTSLTVMANGAVVPCTQDYDAEMFFGNIKENTLEQIWNNEQYREFRRWHITGDFPKGHKCVSRCDQKKVYQYINE